MTLFIFQFNSFNTLTTIVIFHLLNTITFRFSVRENTRFNYSFTYKITFCKQRILVYQYHFYFDNIAHKHTDDHIV